MAIVLEPKTSYNLISRTESRNNKLLVHVKLTDSCLRALEEYQLVEVICRQRESANFVCFHITYFRTKALILRCFFEKHFPIHFIIWPQLSSYRYRQDGSQVLNFQDYKGWVIWSKLKCTSLAIFLVDGQLGRYYLFLVSSTIIKSEPGWKWINHSTRC